CLCRFCVHCYLPSFPTRRSSDLDSAAGRVDHAGLLGDVEHGLVVPLQLAMGLRVDFATAAAVGHRPLIEALHCGNVGVAEQALADRKSTRLNSSHVKSSYAVFCL